MTDRKIDFARPMLDDDTREAVMRVLSGTMLVHGSVTHEFETKFAARAGVKHAITVSSCTAGLHLGLFVQDIGTGDRVAVPALTHVATAHAAAYCGADPLFVEVEADTGNLDAAALDDALGREENVKAVTVVHFLGLPCEMDRINAIGARAGAFVMEDCAIALDATYGGRKAGGLGRLGCFSFYPTKHITTIEGGMVTTNDDALAATIRARRAFGYDRGLGERPRPGIYDVNALGYNYRMNEVEAAVGLTQLARLDEWQVARARNFAALKSALSDVDEVTVFESVKGKARSTHFCLNAVLPRDGSVSRDLVIDHLISRGVGTSVHYPKALPLMTYYRQRYGYRPGQFPVAEWLGDYSISLPVGPHITPDDIDYIAQEMRAGIRLARRSVRCVGGMAQ
jgi:perosamine synthetase